MMRDRGTIARFANSEDSTKTIRARLIREGAGLRERKEFWSHLRGRVNQRAQLIAVKSFQGRWKVAESCLEVKRTIEARRGREKLRELKSRRARARAKNNKEIT